MKRLLFLITLALFWPLHLFAYNFLYINRTTNEPIHWEPGTTIHYWLDPGPLGRLTNDQAHTLLKEAMKIWENASPYANVPHFEFAGYLEEDVNGGNYGEYVSLGKCYEDDLASCPTQAQKDLKTVIIFDEDDSILNNTYCKIGGCAAFGTASVFSGDLQDPSSIVSGAVIFGPSAGDSSEKVAASVGLFVHELGHLLGLAHPSLNQQLYFEQPQGWDRYMPSMFFHLGGIQDLVSASLNPDDIAGISTLYPSNSFSANTATIKGQILKSDGTPMMHANVIARNVDDPLCEVFSFLSGRLCQRPFGTVNSAQCQDDNGNILYDGNFLFAGLPTGTYTIEVEEVVDDAMNASLSVAPGVLEQLAGDAEFWNEGDQANEDHLLSSTILVTAGETKDNIDIILNRSEVTTDRIQYNPLSTFTTGLGTNCPETPSVDYAAMIGITDQSSETQNNNDNNDDGSNTGNNESGDTDGHVSKRSLRLLWLYLIL